MPLKPLELNPLCADVRRYENGDVTTKVIFVRCGYGINCQSVYYKIVTTFSIAAGAIRYRQIVPCKVFYR